MLDHDPLIAETLALAQAEVATGSGRLEPAMRIWRPVISEGSKTVRPQDNPFEHEEIRKRVADFKAIQQRFQLERENYYWATMSRVR